MRMAPLIRRCAPPSPRRAGRRSSWVDYTSSVKALLLALLPLIAAPLGAAYASRDVVFPIAGRATGSDGRLFFTALWITNPSESDAVEATLTFRPAAEKLPARVSPLHLAPGETRVLDPLDVDGLGALRITATKDVLASARLYSRMPGESNARRVATSFSAVPVQFAIGSGESATLQGVTPADGRYKIYLAEVAGMPLDISVSLVDPRGITISEKRLYVDKERQVTVDVAELFPLFTSGTATVRVDGANGSGRVVVAGSAIARESQDSSPFEMSFATASRDRMGFLEALTYIAVAAAAGVALFLRR